MNRTALVGIIVVVVIILGIAVYLLIPKTHTTTPTTTTTVTSSETPISVWVADAYTAEAEALLNAFHSSTGIPILMPKGGGSFGLAREIETEGSSAGVTVFMPVALSAGTTDLGQYNSGWAIAFVADQLSIAYTSASINNQYAKMALEDAQSGNWSGFFTILTSGKVKVGISDPNTDPAGCRAWIVLEIAGYLYQHNTSYYFDRMLNNQGNVTASSAAELVPDLTAGNINFLFIYKSAAIAKHLEYIQLPDKLNLGDPAYANFYYNFTYKLATGIAHGSPIYLYITIPKATNNYNEAIQFVIFVVEHSSILSQYGLTPLKPAFLFNTTAVPPQIAQLISEGYLQVANSS
ncbi:MAG: substrate-binding domain-containing protein [Candidatus Aramenus sp.]|nr:substrate-binding domain-containing protein [Candidatus Aramenus sp.]